MKRILFLLLILSISAITHATDFVSKGYVINNDSVRTDGFIRFFRFDETPDKIYFSKNLNGPYTNFKPEDLIEFGYKKQKFISAEVELETSSDYVATLSNHKDFDLIRKHVFLEVIYQGDKNLLIYRFPTAPRKNLYYTGDFKSPALLKRKFYILQKDNKKFKAENSEYKSQLSGYLNIPSVGNKEISGISYSLGDLSSAFSNFYSNHPDQTTYKTPFRKRTRDLYVFAGAGLNNFHDYEDDFDHSYIKSQNAPMLGLGYAFSSLNHLWTTNLEFYYSGQVSFESYHLDQKNPEYYTEYTAKGRYDSFTLAYYLHAPSRMSFGEIFFNGGLYSNINKYSDFVSSVHKVFYSSDELYERDNSKSSETGLLLGTGARKGKLSVEARYLIGTHNILYNNSKFVQRIQFLVACHI